ncbi:uncharacterized protein LOC121369483 [Gigantopelta aegis]|uniref:uncharacterized protein LOC121369483 n=1 Tax=Gigantopelta aegis TaxID=1735272 RepID=UPI001B88DEED|nr:uncharacterized protein LOC121369483 [Gigantopelta aegis]XP_041350524.1 uncharacterized protein LOC121369483 [Gigantopelta aegis]
MRSLRLPTIHTVRKVCDYSPFTPSEEFEITHHSHSPKSLRLPTIHTVQTMDKAFYTTLAAEVGNIKEKFPDATLQHTISIRPNDSMTLRFVYKGWCPSRVPLINVNFSRRRQHKKSETQIENELQAKAKDLECLNSPMLPVLVDLADAIDTGTSPSDVNEDTNQSNTSAENSQSDNTTRSPAQVESSATKGKLEKSSAKSKKTKAEEKTLEKNTPATESPRNVVSGTSKKKTRADSLRPNHFIAIRFSNPDIGNAVEKVIDEMAEHNPVYREACYNRHDIHLTLCTLALYSQDQIDQAVKALQAVKPELVEHAAKKLLNIEGVSEFDDCKVLYGQIQSPQVLLKLHALLEGRLQKEGVTLTDTCNQYTPHMTIGNITQRFRHKNPTVKKFPEDLIKKFKHLKFGLQKVEGIHLCKMGNERRKDGFYTCLTEIIF